MVGTAFVVPQVLGLMEKTGLMPHKRQKEVINRSRDRLLHSGYLERVGGHLRVTSKGRKYLAHLEYSEYKLKKSKRWDGKWRVLIFDIPETRRSLRDKVRFTLRDMGFVLLQNSVWIYPYDCEDVVTLLKHDLRTGKQLLYMIVEELEGGNDLKKIFGLR